MSTEKPVFRTLDEVAESIHDLVQRVERIEKGPKTPKVTKARS